VVADLLVLIANPRPLPRRAPSPSPVDPSLAISPVAQPVLGHRSRRPSLAISPVAQPVIGHRSRRPSMAIPATHPYQATSRLDADWDREDGEEGEACYQPRKIGEREGGTYRRRVSLVWSSGTARTISPFSQPRQR
jgi:hypothetical protein